MKSGVTLATILLFLAAVVSMPRSFAYANGPLPLTLSISGPATVRGGAAIEIEFDLKNTSQELVPVGTDASLRGERNFIIDIHREDGQPIPKTKYGRALLDYEQNEYFEGVVSLVSGDLAPNDTFKMWSILSDVYDMKPGNYVIQAKRRVFNSESSPFVVSNQLTVKVTP